MLHGRLVHVCKTLTDLQILGFNHQNAFGGQAPPGPAGGAIASSPPDPHAAVTRWLREGKGKFGKDEEGRTGRGWRYGKGKER